MDPITASIIAALAAGVTEGFGATAYNALINAIKKKFGKDSKLAQAVTAAEQEPDFEPNTTALAGRVKQAQADQDPELLKLAQALTAALEQNETAQQALGKYNLHIKGGQIGNIGDHAHIEGGIHFGSEKE